MASRARARLRRGGWRRRLLWSALVLALLALLAAIAGVLVLQEQGVTPRALAPYLLKRSTGHNPLIEATGRMLDASLTSLDRGAASAPLPDGLGLGARARPAVPANGREVLVDDEASLRRAVQDASPGDVITLLPGSYRINGKVRPGPRGGTEAAPIVVRARDYGSVTIEMNAAEGFVVAQPWWRFENLTIRGACADHTTCEHAFHVVGKARHFAAVNNHVSDFNAHFKINGENGDFPDDGLIESNTLTNSGPRLTANPVVPIDLVAANGWLIRANLITDFTKRLGNLVSYGGFVKGAGSGNRFDGNLVICEHRVRGYPGQRVGLSLGGGGTGQSYCRDRKCVTEQEGAVLSNNLVMACSDDGFYLNSAARSKVLHNTLIDTAGITVRFPTSSADLTANLVDGPIKARDGGLVRASHNQSTAIAWLYAGRHPVRGLWRDPLQFEFGWDGEAPRLDAPADPLAARDLCGSQRRAGPRYGAFEDFGACLQGRER